ncbi:MAG: 3-keto-disaccharide hydrolase [Chitinophagaceae bacterium]
MNKKIIAGLLITTSISTMAVGQGDPKATEVWEPVPKIITPVIGNKPPSDAVVLFDGKDLSQWQTEKDGSPAKWSLEKEGVMTVKKGAGNVKTRQGFGSCQLHIEWRTPSTIEGEGQGRGNSGIFLMGLYELQVLDSYNNSTYSNGQAGSIYKQLIPLVNASLKPGEWQEYDVIFTAPKFKTDGSLVSPARITVLHNGVLVQNNVELKGGTVYIGQPSYKAHSDKEPLVLQDHGNPISFRNIWVREL